MNQEKIGKFIARKRKDLNLTQSDLAEKLGVSEKSVSNWERGRNMPDLSLFQPLCAILQISLNSFINGEESSAEKINESLNKTILYSSERLKKKNTIIGLVLVFFGILISFSAMTIFKSESSWSSIYAIIGSIIFIIGISSLTKKYTHYQRILCHMALYFLFVFFLILIDYLGVINIHQAPRFMIERRDLFSASYYDTLFYDVITCDKKTKIESWHIVKNRKYSDEDVFNYCGKIDEERLKNLLSKLPKIDTIVISRLVDIETGDMTFTRDLHNQKYAILKSINSDKEISDFLNVLRKVKYTFNSDLIGYSILFQLYDPNSNLILEFNFGEINDGNKALSIYFSEEDKKSLYSFIKNED